MVSTEVFTEQVVNQFKKIKILRINFDKDNFIDKQYQILEIVSDFYQQLIINIFTNNESKALCLCFDSLPLSTFNKSKLSNFFVKKNKFCNMELKRKKSKIYQAVFSKPCFLV